MKNLPHLDGFAGENIKNGVTHINAPEHAQFTMLYHTSCIWENYIGSVVNRIVIL